MGSTTGYVQIWTREGVTWSLQQSLYGFQKKGLFGWSAALGDDTLIVGSPGADVGDEKSAGMAHVYIREGDVWSLQQTIPGIEKDGQFGWSVTVDQDAIAAGAPFIDWESDKDVGQAQVWVRIGTTWSFQQTLHGAVEGNRFGWSLALENDTLAVGIPFADSDTHSSAGLVDLYVRESNSWTLQQTVQGAADDDRLGWSVALNNDMVAIGAPLADPDGVTDGGAAYIWSRSGTEWLLREVAVGEANQDQLGSSIAQSNGTFVIGAPLADVPGANQAGKAYVFEGIYAPVQDGCYVDAPHIAFVAHPLPILVRCNNVINVYGFEFHHSIDGGTVHPQTQSYLPGDVFVSAGDNTLVLVNSITDGYAVSLRQPATPVSGDFTLGRIVYSPDISGTVVFHLDEFVLGSIDGHEIPDAIALVPDVNVTIVDLEG